MINKFKDYLNFEIKWVMYIQYCIRRLNNGKGTCKKVRDKT